MYWLYIDYIYEWQTGKWLFGLGMPVFNKPNKKLFKGNQNYNITTDIELLNYVFILWKVTQYGL